MPHSTIRPSITKRQQAIIRLLYQFRFLNRIQIQQLLGHKDKKRVTGWLKDLRLKNYVDWHYDAKDFSAKTHPAVYYLQLEGIRWLRSQEAYPNLRKRYKEPTRTQSFIDQSLQIAHYSLGLPAPSKTTIHSYATEADYTHPDHPCHNLIELQPHLLISKQENDSITYYLLETIPSSLPLYRLRKRLKDYVNYLACHEWVDHLPDAPTLLFVCPNTATLLYVKRRLRKCIKEEGLEDSARLRCTSTELAMKEGVMEGIWEKI